MTTFYTDSTWVSQVTFKVSGVNTDPSPLDTITARVSRPGGPVTTYQYGIDLNLTQIATGIFQLAVTIDIQGEWIIEWRSTATNTFGKNYDTIVVSRSLIPP